MTEPVRFGILGAARIAPMALIRPARRVPEALVVAIAARDPQRAGRFAARHAIPKVHPTYEALLADSQVEAVYNPLPNALHAPWTLRALAAGKHVLCEKPFSATVVEAEEMARAARDAGKVLVEAFHYRYHPLFERVHAIVSANEIGVPGHVEASLCFPLLRPGDIRYRKDLAGGALMDAGCYAVHLLRHLVGAEPEVVGAEARWTAGGVDRWMRADLRFPGGPTGRVMCSLLATPRASLRVEGSAGVLRVFNPYLPHIFHRLRVLTPTGSRTERVIGPQTYDCQLRAFVQAVRHGDPVPTGPEDAIANMRVIEAIYAAAGRPVSGAPTGGRTRSAANSP